MAGKTFTDKLNWVAAKKGEEATSLNEVERTGECVKHAESELLDCHRAILICKSHHPVWSFTMFSDEELCYHVVRMQYIFS